MPYKDPEVRKLKNRGYHKVWYQKYRSAAIHAAVDVKKRTRRAKRRYLLKNVGSVCTECDFSEDSTAIDFHHIDGRDIGEKNVAELSWTDLKRLVTEDKLVALCANCHRILHSNARKEARKEQ